MCETIHKGKRGCEISKTSNSNAFICGHDSSFRTKGFPFYAICVWNNIILIQTEHKIFLFRLQTRIINQALDHAINKTSLRG
jgi:hypothetical protein